MSNYNRILRERRDAMQNDDDDRVLRCRTDQQILNSVTPVEDELEIFFNNNQEDTDSSSSFRNMSLSPSYNTRRTSPSSYTFMSSEEGRDRRNQLIEEKEDRKNKLKILKRKIAQKKYNNATRKIQNAYKKYLSKKNKKNNEKGDECLILGGKKKRNKRKKTKRKKNKRRKTSRRYKR